MKTTASTPRRPLPLRVWGFVRFLLFFFRALFLSAVDLAGVVLSKRREAIVPGFVFYPVEHLSKLEILVLSHCITLTPGSATVEVAPDFRSLTLHILDTRTIDAVVKGIRDELEDPILRWTR